MTSLVKLTADMQRVLKEQRLGFEEIRASWLQYWHALYDHAAATDDRAIGSEIEPI